MKIIFDDRQAYQLEAVQAAVDLFEGQPLAENRFELRTANEGSLAFNELGFGNRLMLNEEALLTNLCEVQAKHKLALSEHLAGTHFSVEMETGTGKTYVYLRTLFALHQAYGFSKFVIVVPSVAIREGVLASLRLMRKHFDVLFDHVAYDYCVYDSKNVSRLRQFATASSLQILVINIDAFNKGANVINNDQDGLSGYRPIEFIQAAHPIVILDEPQNMESDTAKKAIESLNPLCTLRYSATHRNAYNLIYSLNPVQAYDLGLVKRIEVDSVLDEPDFNRPYLFLKEIKAGKTTLIAKMEMDVDTPQGVRRKILTVKHGQGLQELANGRSHYVGYVVNEIGTNRVSFSNGLNMSIGEITGSARDDIMRVQIRNTIREHFEKELQVAALPPENRMKILSLFFIDKVANYTDDEGKIRRWFVDEYRKISKEPRFSTLLPLPVENVHNGYFSVGKDKIAKDTNGSTQADDDAYELIMRDKERLLQLEEPLRFIFSHSALREGWDNPNVFQICTLADSKSEIRKRQEIGRGLRLPVMANGMRCMNRNMNRLTVIANESYEDFARRLQAEIQDETGVSFGDGRIANKRKRKSIHLKKNWQTEEFLELWKRIRPRTRYQVDFKTEDLIKQAAKTLSQQPPLHAIRITSRKVGLGFTKEGIATELQSIRVDENDYRNCVIPDLLGYLQRETEMTRSTLVEILQKSGRLGEVVINPQQFLDQALAVIRETLKELMVEGIKYEKIAESWYEMHLFEQAEVDAYEERVQEVDKSIFNAVEFDSEVEQRFAVELDKRTDIRLFLKLPGSFTVETPLGKYNPDWAIVKHGDTRIYLVRETKSALGEMELRGGEVSKIKCGKAHFKALDVDFQPVTSASEV
jgi:type III restriction enzyme